MRYSAVSTGLTIQDVERVLRQHGATGIRVAPRVNQVMCDLDPSVIAKLNTMTGLSIKAIRKIGSAISPPTPASTGESVFGMYAANNISTLYQLRHYFDPPLTGAGYTIAVLDSGIRKTHRGLVGKVIHEENFSDSLTMGDVFDHGTGVAWVCVGGQDAPGEESGIAPGASLMNFKVIGDSGEGTVEDAVLAIERVMELREQHADIADPLRPACINISFGAVDTGDPEDPLRVACRAAAEVKMGVVCAAGNGGPTPGTILSPACDPDLIAVGSVKLSPLLLVSDFSSRGPTIEGTIKPDIVFFGENILVASCVSDDAFVAKSGTSFATPFVSAGNALAQELGIKVLGMSPDELWGIAEWAKEIPQISMKYQGELVGKDNSYGYGMPYGELVTSLFSGAVMGPSMLGAIMPVMVLAMMIPMIGKVMKT